MNNIVDTLKRREFQDGNCTWVLLETFNTITERNQWFMFAEFNGVKSHQIKTRQWRRLPKDVRELFNA